MPIARFKGFRVAMLLISLSLFWNANTFAAEEPTLGGSDPGLVQPTATPASEAPSAPVQGEATPDPVSSDTPATPPPQAKQAVAGTSVLLIHLKSALANAPEDVAALALERVQKVLLTSVVPTFLLTSDPCPEGKVACYRSEARSRGMSDVLVMQLLQIDVGFMVSMRRMEAASDEEPRNATRQAQKQEELLNRAVPDALQALFPDKKLIQVTTPEPAKEPVLSSTRNIRPDQLFLYETARPNTYGRIALDFVYGASLNLNYQVTDNIRMGTYVLPPAYLVGILPHLSAHFKVHDIVHLGVTVMGGFFYPMWDDELSYAFGGGPMLTIGPEWLMVNVSFMAFGFGGDDVENDDNDWLTREALLLPAVGMMIQVSPRILLGAEITVPLTTKPSKSDLDRGMIWLVQYGLRVQGSGALYADVGFWAPMSKYWFRGSDDEYDNDAFTWAKCFPFGVPYFKIGLNF